MASNNGNGNNIGNGNCNGGDNIGQTISDAVDAGMKACIVLMCVPLKIYAKCLHCMAKVASDVADSLCPEDEAPPQQ
jgi:hypothetical protein